jgi:hypothetical protein
MRIARRSRRAGRPRHAPGAARSARAPQQLDRAAGVDAAEGRAGRTRGVVEHEQIAGCSSSGRSVIER